MRKLTLGITAALLLATFTGAGCITVNSAKTSDGGIFRSDDSGENWAQKVFIRKEKKKIIAISNVSVGTIEFNPQDKNMLYLGTLGNGIYRSKDGGEQWEIYGINAGNFSTISVDPKTPAIVYTASGSSIYKTADDGLNWETIYLEPRNQKIVSVIVDSYYTARIYAATDGGSIIQSTDYGVTWASITNLTFNLKKLYLNPADTRIIYAVTNGQGILKTNNGAESWYPINEDLEKFNGAKNINWFVLNESNPDNIYIATNYGIFKSSNGGINWEEIKTLFPAGTVPINTVSANPKNEAEIWFTYGKIIHKTTDAAATWKVIENFPSARNINYLLVRADEPNTIYAGTYYAKKK